MRILPVFVRLIDKKAKDLHSILLGGLFLEDVPLSRPITFFFDRCFL